jgi:hypothetical protein
MPEHSDIRARGIGVGAAIVFAGIAVSLAAAWAVTSYVAAPATGPSRGEPPAIEGARLQTAPERDIAAFNREKRARLEGYGRVDEGHLHIPIERAMQILANGHER